MRPQRRLTIMGVTLAIGLMAPTAAPVIAAGAAWTTDHFDSSRSGADPNDPELGTAITSRWTSPTLDGRVYGEPLYLNGVVYVATQNNSVYALDASDGHVLWGDLAITPAVPLSEVHSEAPSTGLCGNIDPLGIIGTPVIDPTLGSAGTLFAVAETYQLGVVNSIEHRLLRVDLASHAVTSRNVDPVFTGFTNGSTRALEQERGALNIANGYVVTPYGGLAGDCGPYHGFAVSSLEDLSGAANTFAADPSAGNARGGIWAPAGAAVDGAGTVYLSTGNGTEPATGYDLSDGIVKLPPTMGQPPDTGHYFAPDVWHADNASDLDLGSLTPTIVPRSGQSALVFATGKQHIGFLLDSANLGGVGGQLFPPLATEATTGHVCDGDARGGTTYFAPFVYVPCIEGLRAVRINTSAPSFARAWIGPSDANGPPVMAGGRIWVHGASRIYGLNATTGATEVTLGNVSTPYNFGSPSAGGGRLYFATGTQIAGFTGGPPPPPPGGTNLFGALVNGGASGQVEVHGLSQQSHYSQFIAHAASAFAATNTADWQFLVAPVNGDGQPDLYGVHLRNTSSGMVEVHAASAASGYRNFIVHAATPLPAVSAGRFQFAFAGLAGDGRSNLYAIALNNTGSGRVEVHALSEASNYATWMMHSASALGAVSATDWQFRVSDRFGSGDLIGIFHGTTGSGNTEVHALSRSSGYQVFTIHAATPLGPTADSQWSYAIGDHDADHVPDIYVLLMNGGASGRTEVHVLSGAVNYTNWNEHAASGLGPTDPTAWQFSTH
jgi:outer membrane protein assembly factor BamB